MTTTENNNTATVTTDLTVEQIKLQEYYNTLTGLDKLSYEKLEALSIFVNCELTINRYVGAIIYFLDEKRNYTGSYIFYDDKDNSFCLESDYKGEASLKGLLKSVNAVNKFNSVNPINMLIDYTVLF